jgi:hypothetical protein
MSFDDMIEGAARAFYVMAWENAMIEAGRASEVHISGANLMDLAPETPECVKDMSRRFLKEVKRVNANALASAFLRTLTGWFNVRYPQDHHDDFGHYLAMEAMGTGVAWSDSHEDHELDVPSVDIPLCDPGGDEPADFTFEMDFRFMRSKQAERAATLGDPVLHLHDAIEVSSANCTCSSPDFKPVNINFEDVDVCSKCDKER